MECNVITLQPNYCKLQCVLHVLHKTTYATTQNYRLYYTKIHYTTDKMQHTQIK